MKTYIVTFSKPFIPGFLRVEVEAETKQGAREAFQLLHPAAKVYDVFLKTKQGGKEK